VYPVVGAVVSAGLATLTELKTTLSIKDMFDLAEILAINNHNQRIAMEQKE